MRLAFCIFKYFPFGGLQRNFLNILQFLLDRGHHITVYTTQWDGEVPEGIHLTCVAAHAFSNHGKVQRFANAVRSLMQTEEFDAVIGFNKIPGLDVYYAGDPCYDALTQRRYSERLGSFEWLRWFNPRYHRYRSMEKAVFDPMAQTQILFLSPNQQSEFLAHYGTPSARCHMLPPGMLADRQPVADRVQARQKIRQEFHIPEDEFVMLMTGSCLKTKGLDRALHALSSLPRTTRSRCQLLTVGDERARAFIPLAKKLGIQDRLHISGPRSDIPTFMASSDVLLHPAYSDNTGTVLLESMVYALPSVVTEVCGYARYVSAAKAGTVVPNPFEQTRLNHALLDMLSSPRRHEWGQNGATFIKTLDLSSRFLQAATLVESVARERAHARTTA